MLRDSEELAAHIPVTGILSKDLFRYVLERNNHVILKPVGGSRGAGVFKISPKGNNWWDVHYESRKKTIYGIGSTYAYVRRKIGGRRYLIQRYIPLARVDGRPFDVRLIVQRKRHSHTWEVTAKAAKVAGSGYIVTNITRSGGTLLPLETAIHRSSLQHNAHEVESKIHKLALLSAKRLSKYFPRHRIYGLDIGVDQSGKVWIIEANLYPSMSHFRKLGNWEMYERIQRYKRGG